MGEPTEGGLKMAKKVLVIDDDPDFAEAVMVLLKAKGYEVLAEDNGEAGYQTAKKEKPHLVLLDVMMTHKTEGFDVARHLQEDLTTQKIPVVIVTGIRKDMDIPFGFEPDQEWLPVKAVLEKPVKPELLLKTVADNVL